MYDSKRVEFSTARGVMLRGDLFPTEEDTKRPVIIMTQGLTLLKEHYLPDWAVRFQAAGFTVLIYDHRGWGSSEGTPRNTVDPLQQAEDYHDAVLFARSLPSIDPDRIALWGIGHSGGAVMIAAGDNPYVKCVVLVMPFNSGTLDAQACPPGRLKQAWDERIERCAAGRVEDSAKRPLTYSPVWDDTAEQAGSAERGDVFLQGSRAFEFIDGAEKRSKAAGTPWKNRMSLESFYRLSKAEPRDHIRKIAPKSMLYLVATTDPLSGPLEEQKKTFAMAGEGVKEFVVLTDEHIHNYFGESFDKNMDAQVRFVRKWL